MFPLGSEPFTHSCDPTPESRVVGTERTGLPFSFGEWDRLVDRPLRLDSVVPAVVGMGGP